MPSNNQQSLSYIDQTKAFVLSQICLVKEFEYEYFYSLPMDCAICMAAPDNPEVVACCQNVFCSQCLASWVEVRSCCPLCIAPLGLYPKNQLSKPQSQEFDNGSLMLENEMAAAMEKIKYLRMLLKAKFQTANHFKSHFPKAHLDYVEEGMRSAQQNFEIASLAVSEGDRVTATATLQTIAEDLLSIQSILLGESTLFIESEDYSDEDDYYDEEEYEMEEEIYMRSERDRIKNVVAKGGSKKKI